MLTARGVWAHCSRGILWSHPVSQGMKRSARGSRMQDAEEQVPAGG